MGIAERKEREREQRRNEIITGAEKIFFEKGYDSATLDEVADAAELSKATLYLYFKNKEELYYAIYERGLERLKQFFSEAISPTNDSLQNIVAIGENYVKFVQTYPDYFKTILYFKGKLLNNPLEEELMDLFIMVIDQGIKDKVINSEYSAPVLATLLWAQTTGVLQLIVTEDVHLKKYNLSADKILEGHFRINVEGFIKKG